MEKQQIDLELEGLLKEKEFLVNAERGVSKEAAQRVAQEYCLKVLMLLRHGNVISKEK